MSEASIRLSKLIIIPSPRRSGGWRETSHGADDSLRIRVFVQSDDALLLCRICELTS